MSLCSMRGSPLRRPHMARPRCRHCIDPWVSSWWVKNPSAACRPCRFFRSGAHSTACTTRSSRRSRSKHGEQQVGATASTGSAHAMAAAPSTADRAVDAAPIHAPFLRHRVAVSVTATAGAVLVMTRYSSLPDRLIAAFIAIVLVVVAATDLERRIIPNRVIVPALAVVLVARIATSPGETAKWTLAALGAGLLFLLPNLINSSDGNGGREAGGVPWGGPRNRGDRCAARRVVEHLPVRGGKAHARRPRRTQIHLALRPLPRLRGACDLDRASAH